MWTPSGGLNQLCWTFNDQWPTCVEGSSLNISISISISIYCHLQFLTHLLSDWLRAFQTYYVLRFCNGNNCYEFWKRTVSIIKYFNIICEPWLYHQHPQEGKFKLDVPLRQMLSCIEKNKILLHFPSEDALTLEYWVNEFPHWNKKTMTFVAADPFLEVSWVLNLQRHESAIEMNSNVALPKPRK